MCHYHPFLSFSIGRWVTSYNAETYTILHALKWYILFFLYNFESVTLFFDSQYALIALSAPLPYPNPLPTPNYQPNTLLNFLSDGYKVVHLHWVSVYSSLPGNDLSDSLAKFDTIMNHPPPYHSSAHLLFPPNIYPSKRGTANHASQIHAAKKSLFTIC